MNTNKTLKLKDGVEFYPVNENGLIWLNVGWVDATQKDTITIEETKLLIEFLTAQVREFEASQLPPLRECQDCGLKSRRHGGCPECCPMAQGNQL